MRVIGSDGEMIGVLSRDEALRMAEEEDLDLVEIQPNADPPVCKIMDFGKFRFEQQKKANEAKKKQKQVEIKEVKFRPVTDEGDYQIKLRKMREFLVEVIDGESGEPIPGARVTVHESCLIPARFDEDLSSRSNMGASRKLEREPAISGADGLARLEGLPSTGSFDAEVEADGFRAPEWSPPAPRFPRLLPAGEGTPARVLDVRFLGDVALVELAVEGLETPFLARVREGATPAQGAGLGIGIDAGAVLIFPAEDPAPEAA